MNVIIFREAKRAHECTFVVEGKMCGKMVTNLTKHLTDIHGVTDLDELQSYAPFQIRVSRMKRDSGKKGKVSPTSTRTATSASTSSNPLVKGKSPAKPSKGKSPSKYLKVSIGKGSLHPRTRSQEKMAEDEDDEDWDRSK